MENNNSKGVIALLIVIIIILGVLCVLFATDTLSLNIDNNKLDKTNTTENKEAGIDNNNETTSNEQKSTDNKELTITGTYNKKSETEQSYYNSTIIITNKTDSSIDFKISTAHGRDAENVNIGNVSGTAKKISEDEYSFEETVDGNNNKITFKFSAHRMFQFLTINESYANNINPYGGHGVYFSGDYEKIS